MGLVLVAEDDPSTMFVICSVVKRMGHIALRAGNGRIAWEIIRENYDSIHLLITDLMMPEMDGHDLIHSIRQDIKTAKMPIIVQSAYLGVRGTKQLMEEGVDAVIPFRTMLADLVANTAVNRNYTKSDLLQTIRILKKYDFFREPQLELFKGKRRHS